MSIFYTFIDVPDEFHFEDCRFLVQLLDKMKLGGSDFANNRQQFVHKRIKTKINKSENIFILG